jgi:hypothetical protein
MLYVQSLTSIYPAPSNQRIPNSSSVCGNNLVQGAVVAPESECNMGCGGLTTSVSFFTLCKADSSVTNSSEACGGPNRVSVYNSTGSVTALAVPIVQTTNLPENWKYSHCLAYVYFASLKSCNRPGAAHSDQQRAWCRPGLPVSDYIPTEQHGPKLSVAMFKIRLPRGGYGICG